MKNLLLFSAWLLLNLPLLANNVQISNVTYVAGINPNTSYIQFDLSWENSWRLNTAPSNYDGVYVFFKVRNANTGWMPVIFRNAGNTIASGFNITQFSAQHVGALIHRDAGNTGSGNCTLTGIQLGVEDLPVFNAEMKAFAIEMVNVPALGAASFCVGDSIGTQGSDYTLFSPNATPGIHYATIHSGAWALIRTLPNSPIDGYSFKLDGVYIKGDDSLGYWTTNSFPPFQSYIAYNKYPTGCEMWCMKYEITQGAYRDFLNMLAYNQQVLHTTNDPASAAGTLALVPSGSSYRNGIMIQSPSVNGLPAVYGCDLNGNGTPDEANDGEFVACGWLNRDDINAWLWWAGLSPMTEIQYERIARGYIGYTPILSSYNDFAWGDTNFVTTPYTLLNAGAANESISNLNTASANALVGYNGLAFDGPVRNGIFATPSSNRLTSGSSLFGIMELTGNLSEACVQLGDASNNDFYDARGFGALSLYFVPTGILNLNGKSPINVELIQRGGSFASPSSRCGISSRGDGPYTVIRTPTGGGRGVINLYLFNQ